MRGPTVTIVLADIFGFSTLVAITLIVPIAFAVKIPVVAFIVPISSLFTLQ